LKGGFEMAEGLHRVTEEMMEIGPRIFSQVGKQLESLQEMIGASVINCWWNRSKAGASVINCWQD
jgi:hypothetical protein